MNSSKRVIIYTDGACSGNPGPGGYGIVFYFGNEYNEKQAFNEKILVHNGGETHTTNNRMELLAVIEALRLSEAFGKDTEMDIYSDSAYVVNNSSEGLLNHWKRNGFKSIRGKDISNLDLWKRFIIAKQDKNIKIFKVKGHADNELNCLADRLAVSACKKYKEKING